MVALVLLLAGGIFALSHTAPFPFLLEAFRPNQSVWRIKTPAGAPPAVYLTFDDGPNLDWTPAVLDALADEGAKATFFLIDRHITSETAPIVQRIAREGHAIALHTGSRRPMFKDPDDFAEEIARNAARIQSIAGIEPCRFVPAARRMAERADVRRPEARERQARRLVMGPVGLGTTGSDPNFT